MRKKYILITLYIMLIFSAGCKEQFEDKALFSKIPARHSGIDFKNTLRETPEFNVLKYGYFYNGGGVAVGDINNDGLDDIYMTANLKASHLYLNKGDFNFENIAATAGVEAAGLWNTGATMVDINNDGWLDIYVCRSAAALSHRRKNLLFVNNKDLTFTEMSEVYGLDDMGYSTQAVFFDYDRDGDLDMYILNHSAQEYSGFGKNMAHLREQTSMEYGDRLYRNDTWEESGQTIGRFTDVTTISGIKSNVLGFGLGVAINDFNNDGWADIYVSNDYNLEDYLYINQQDGTFSETIRNATAVTSLFSMGSDAADVNNDGYVDILTLDMLPPNHERIMLTSGVDNYNKKQALYDAGFHRQTMRNMLQLNDGSGTFKEIGQLAGISNSDWSMAALFGDLDMDGYQDIFITNGYKADYTNMDFVSYAVAQQMESQQSGKAPSIEALIEKMPSIDINNQAYKNMGDLTFEDMSMPWGLGDIVSSSGAAMADLDNDGDLDLIINNVNQIASLYENQSPLDRLHFLKIALKGDAQNKFGIGAQIQLKNGDYIMTRYMMTTRGYQSSVPPYVLFGLGPNTVVDELRIQWPDGRIQTLYNVAADQYLTLEYDDTVTPPNNTDLVCKVTLSESRVDSLSQSYVINFGNAPLMYRQYADIPARHIRADLDGDGIIETIDGGAITSEYPYATPIVITSEGGNSDWTMESTTILSGMEVADMDQDGSNAIIYAAEWQPIRLVTCNNNIEQGLQYRAVSTEKGLWSALHIADLNKDGRLDIIAGNIGLNNQFAYLGVDSLNLFVADFDNNGKSEAVLCKNWGGEDFVFNFRDDLMSQLPVLKKKFTSYQAYAKTPFKDFFAGEQFDRAERYSVNLLASVIYYNEGGGHYRMQQLPHEAQLGPITQFLTVDVNQDGHLDIIYGGGVEAMSEQLGSMLSIGCGILLSDGSGQYVYDRHYNCALSSIHEEVKDLRWDEDSRSLNIMTSSGSTYTYYIHL